MPCPDRAAEIKRKDPALHFFEPGILARQFLDPARDLEPEGDRQRMAIVGTSGHDGFGMSFGPGRKAAAGVRQFRQHCLMGSPHQQEPPGGHNILRGATPVDIPPCFAAGIRKCPDQ
ncbi:MAG: hypothetical protein CML24_07835 [Rhizobiales bacterium]|nr:hypothetical protein [Hyphomicrobiales bacterium]